MNYFQRDTTLMHLNESILCSICIRTTGPYAGYHDMIELCILALDGFLKPSKLAIPFTCILKMKRPEHVYIEEKTLKGYASKSDMCNAQIKGLDPNDAADRLDDWVNKFQLKNEKKIFALAMDWPFIRSFFVDWLGPMNFEKLFDQRYRDLIPASTYVMDRCDFLIEQKPYWKPASLTYMCKVLAVDRSPPYDCMTDTLAVAACYKSMMKGLI